jgi:hypothetical protein
VSALISLNRRLEVDSAGFRYLNASRCCSCLPSYCWFEFLKSSLTASRVAGSKTLKSWSRSTAVVVLAVEIVDPSSISASFRPSRGVGGSVRST